MKEKTSNRETFHRKTKAIYSILIKLNCKMTLANTLTDWSIISDLKFNSSKSVHLSFKSRIATSCTMFDNPILSTDSHKDLTKQFNITNYISFSSTSTRLGTSNKLAIVHPHHLNNKSRHFYFHRIPGFWNAISIINLNKSFEFIKHKLKIHFWNHFVKNYDDGNYCTLHYLCPCSSYMPLHKTTASQLEPSINYILI